MAKVLCVLYDDPVSGYPKTYARDTIPKIERYADGQTTPTPQAIDFRPGALLGSVSGELGLRKFLESRGSVHPAFHANNLIDHLSFTAATFDTKHADMRNNSSFS